MTLRQSLAWQSALLALSIVLSAIIGPKLPATVPTHWGPSGQPDAWGSPALAIWFGPVMGLFLLALTVGIPWMPGGDAVAKSGRTYGQTMLATSGLFAYMHAGILFATWRGTDFPAFIIAGIFLFFAVLGSFLKNVKPNPYMGIRTPWTMSNEKVWEISHRRAGQFYTYAGGFGALVTLAGLPTMLVIVLIVVVSIWPIVDSYLVAKQVERNG